MGSGPITTEESIFIWTAALGPALILVAAVLALILTASALIAKDTWKHCRGYSPVWRALLDRETWLP